ncbi:50S ribosomal protein L16 [Candidatus Woesearchaeota archaeon]|nr:50S ribosomal protein L16 [Candidatus Woesearchaeota archaeon]
MGNLKGEFPVTLVLKSKEDLQIRHNALEAARQSMNRYLETKVGNLNYRFTVRVYPHHILRNNPLAAGAGADRMSTGMARSFGKVVGIAARVRKGQPIFQVDVAKQFVSAAKTALVRAKNKMPGGCAIEEVRKPAA